MADLAADFEALTGRKLPDAPAAAVSGGGGGGSSSDDDDSDDEPVVDPTAPTGFIGASGFTGRKPGYIFKRDDELNGTGFYLDDPHTARVTQARMQAIQDEEDAAVAAAFGGRDSDDEDEEAEGGRRAAAKGSFFGGNALGGVLKGNAGAKRPNKFAKFVVVKKAKVEEPAAGKPGGSEAGGRANVSSLLGSAYGSGSDSDSG